MDTALVKVGFCRLKRVLIKVIYRPQWAVDRKHMME